MFALPLAIHLQIQDHQQQQYHHRLDLLHRLHTAEQQLQHTLQAVRTTTTNIIVHNNSSTFSSNIGGGNAKSNNSSSWAATVLANAGVSIGGNGIHRHNSNGMHNNTSAMDADHIATQLLSAMPFTPNNSSLSTILQQHRQHQQQTVGRHLMRPPSLAHQSQRSVSLISMDDGEEMQDVQSAVTAGSMQSGAADADLYNGRSASFDHDASDADDFDDDGDELLLVDAPRTSGSFVRFADDEVEPLTGVSYTSSVGASGTPATLRSGGSALQRPQTAAGSSRSAQRSDDSMELMEAFVDGAQVNPVDGELDLANEFQQELLRRQLQRAQAHLQADDLAVEDEEDDVEYQLALQASLQEAQTGVADEQPEQYIDEQAKSDDEPEWGSDL